MPNKTILIAAGGTGGHLYPALAVAEEILRMIDHAPSEQPETNIIFIGTRERIESKEVPRAGFPFVPLDIHAPRKSFSSLLTFPWKFAKAIVDCVRLIVKERPSAVLGAGAYLSVPVGIAAWMFHVPIALLEINSVPGSANKVLAYLADKLFLAYPEAAAKFPTRIAKHTTVCGTPVRATLGQRAISIEEARSFFRLDPSRATVLVFGGSLGAGTINEAMRVSVQTFVSQGYNVLWQTGRAGNAKKLEEEFANTPNVRVADYIYDMERAYRAADVVVCRAGASSLAELAQLGKPAVLVPWPGAMANHQELNAQAFERDGAAVVLRDSEVKSTLADTVLVLIRDGERLRRMSEAMRRRDHPEAAIIVAQWLAKGV